MKRLAILILLAGCSTAGAEPSPTAETLDWLSGCWENPNGSYREIWSQSEHGHFFGYAVTLKDSSVSFFEQMHIAPGQPNVFNAYPAGIGPTPFPESERTGTSITFANPEHDYPQIIAYRTTEAGLSARISSGDGSDARDFDFIPCAD